MKKEILFIALCSIGCVLSLLAQFNKSNQHDRFYKEADRLYNLDEPTPATDSIAIILFLKTANSVIDTNNPLAVECFIKAGNIHQGYQRFAKANELYHAAINLNKRTENNPASFYEAYLYLGSSHYFSSVIDSAQYYFETASVIAANYTGKLKLPSQDRLYNSLGSIYFESANYLQAKNYFERAMEFLPPKADDYNEIYTGIKSNIANCLMKLNQYDSALSIFKSLQPDEQQKEIIKHNTAHSYFELGRYDSALAIYESLSLKNSFASVVALTDMGRIYMMRKQWQQAEAVFDSAIERNRNISITIKNKEEALAYLYRSQLSRQQGLVDEALSWVNEALKEVHLDFTWNKTEDLPADVSKTVSPITLFLILHEKGQLLYEKFTRVKQEALLIASLKAYIKAIETANFIKLNFDNDEAKLFFNQSYRPIYSEAIQVAYEAFHKDNDYIDDYLFIIENYKGSILQQNLQTVLLKSKIQLPDSTRRKEKEIKQLIAFYTTRLNQSVDEKNAEQMRKKLLSLQVELSRLQKNYERDANYNLYKYQVTKNRLTLSAIQSFIDGNTALINYFTTSTAVYCLVVSEKKVHLQRTSIDSIYDQSFRDFIQEVYHYEEGKRYEGFASSARLYQYLIKPVEKALSSFDKWIILPSANLYYLPFEAIVPDAKSREYLVLSKKISYHYSFALLFRSNTEKFSQGNYKQTIGFAPYSTGNAFTISSGLPELPLSGIELAGVTGVFFKGSDATKQKFIEQTSNYPVIHLATHASIGSDSSSNWIQFYPEDSVHMNHKLYLQEVYNLDLHKTELVILSACETAGGITSTGEGLLSLSRAFLYAGAAGIVSTLWKTEDRVTAFLMQRLHVYLKQNKTPEEALQMAKNDLLADKEMGSQYKTPNYWANFIYVGKSNNQKQKYENTDTSTWKYIAAVTALSALLLFFFKQRKSFT